MLKMRYLKILGLILGILLLSSISIATAYAIWPLTVFNMLMPKDAARVVARNVAYGSHPRQHYDLYAPLQGDKLPLLIFVHGGFWNSGGKDGYDFVGHAFASKGYLTALIEYRLVPDVQYPGFVEDTAKAVAHLRAHAAEYGGDPTRVYLVGHSAGAYNVVQAALNPQFAAEMGTIKAIAGMAGPYVFKPEDHEILRSAFGNVSSFESALPESFVKADEPPILMVHGKDDDIVVPKAYMEFYVNAKQAGAEIELKVHPGTNHISILGDLSWPFRYRSSTYTDIIDFFAAHP